MRRQAGFQRQVPFEVEGLLVQLCRLRLNDDREALDDAAAVLSAAVAELLQDVGSRVVPPEAYHVM